MYRTGSNRHLPLWLTLTTLTFAILVVTLTAYIYAEQRVDQVNEQRLRSLQLADELRHSSDNLTRMVRSYVVTGDPTYKTFYREILAIRDGRQPRPEHYQYYWDRIMPGEPRPAAGHSRPVALLTMVAEAALGAEESRLLTEAKRSSDALAQTEEEAMRLFESSGADAAANRQRARDMLFDERYLHAKLEIIRPISDFSERMDRRTAHALDQALFLARLLRGAFIVIGLFWLYLLWHDYRALRVLLGGAPRQVQAEIERLGEGDLSPSPRPAPRDSVIGWLNLTRQRLQALTRAHLEARSEVEEHGHYLRITNQILQQIGENAPLSSILDQLMLSIEERHPDTYCSILLVSEDGRELRHAAAPSMPPFWNQAIARLPIAESVGSCGTAAFRGERVIVENVATHPYWGIVRELAARAGLGACWSQPFKDSHGKVLGTFAIYHRRPAAPSAKEIQLIEDYAKLAQLAVERARLAEALRRSEERYRLIADNCNDVIWLVDLPALTFSYVSPSIQRLRGWTPEEILDQPLEILLGTEAAGDFRSTLSELASRLAAPDCPTRHAIFETELQHRNGQRLPTEVAATLLLDAAGKPCQILGISRDISERRAAEETIRHMAYYDPLTNLPNRRLMGDRLAQLLAQAHRHQRRLALLFIDLDKFKPVNDQYGHETGDWLLQQAAQRLQQALRAAGTVARIGGDEFVVLLPDIAAAEDAVRVAEKLRAALEQPFVTARGDVLQLSSSIGVVLYPDHGDTPRDLLRFGDEAMYRAKQAGRNAVEVFAAQQAPKLPPRPTWLPAYATGNPLIDEEHRELFRRVGALLDLVARPDAEPAQIDMAFDALLDHLAEHCRHEEEILGSLAYPELREHAEQHRWLLQHARELRHSSDAASASTSAFVAFVASELLSEHLQHEDRKFHSLFAAPPAAATSEA